MGFLDLLSQGWNAIGGLTGNTTQTITSLASQNGSSLVNSLGNTQAINSLKAGDLLANYASKSLGNGHLGTGVSTLNTAQAANQANNLAGTTTKITQQSTPGALGLGMSALGAFLGFKQYQMQKRALEDQMKTSEKQRRALDFDYQKNLTEYNKFKANRSAISKAYGA